MVSPDPAAGRREGWSADEARSESVIRTHALARSFAGRPAVRSIDLEMARGEIFGLVGPDGAGKTTLIQMLCGILDPTGGRATVLGCDLPGDAERLVPRLGYMSQAFSLYGKLTVAENIEFFADLRGVSRAERVERTRRILEFSRLAPYVDRTAEKQSGGMKKKLALATTLLHDPEILVLDEPTTGVDPLSRRDFWQIVFDFLREGITVVVATPYMDEAERCHRVALMHDGRILALETPDGLKEDLIGRLVEIRSPDETRVLDAARGAPGVPVEEMQRLEPTLEDVFASRLSATTGRTKTATTADRPPVSRCRADGTGPPPVEAVALSRRFGSFTAVDGLSFALRRGEIFGFLGPNGSGKSTTIRMLTGLLRPTDGVARVAGRSVEEGRRVRTMVGYMSQRFSLYDDLTVDENLEFFAGAYGLSGPESHRRRQEVLRMVGLTGREETLAGSLPGGWKQRLALASAVLHRPPVLFLDEPTSGVDPPSRRLFWDLIVRLARGGVTVLVTTHYMDEAERCDRVGMLSRGRLVALGTPAELRDRVDARLLEAPVESPLAALPSARALAGVREATLRGTRLHLLVDPGTEEREIRHGLARAGHPPTSVAAGRLTMEDVFVAVLHDAEPAEGEER